MNCPKRFNAFTLVELLAVLVIIGLMLAISGGMSKRARDTFVAQQYIKNTVQNARVLRRKSMLVSRNSSSKEWVHGIGFRLEKSQGNVWTMKQIKVLGTATDVDFYKTFPKGECLQEGLTVGSFAPCGLAWVQLEGTNAQPLAGDLQFFIQTRVNAKRFETCNYALTVLYESINGDLHVFCKDNAGAADLPIDFPLRVDTDKLVNLYILYEGVTADRYKQYVNLTNNGEIDAIQSP